MGLGLTGLKRTVGRRYALCLVTCQLYRVVSVNKDLRWASSACVSSSLCRINQQPFRISRVSAVTEPGVSSSTMGREDNKSASLGGNLYLFISLISITQLMFMCRAAQWSSVYLYQRHFNKMHKTKTSRREIISVLISRHSNFLKHPRTLGLFFLLVDEDHSKTDADRRTGSFNQSTLCTSAGSSTSVRLSLQTVLLQTKWRVSNCLRLSLVLLYFSPLCPETQPPTPASTASSSIRHISDSELRLKTTRFSLVFLVTMLSALTMMEYSGVTGERAARTMKRDTWHITSACWWKKDVLDTSFLSLVCLVSLS